MQWRLFEGMPEAEVRVVLSLARRRTFRRGEVVVHRGDPADSVHLISKGRFDVCIGTALGDVVALAIRGPGETFGELALLTGEERTATVTSLEPGETLVSTGLGAAVARPGAPRARRGARAAACRTGAAAVGVAL